VSRLKHTVDLDTQDKTARAEWESDGGRVVESSRSDEHDGSRWPPRLPPGHTAQPAWGFHDETGRHSYEFNRVYGPPMRRDHRGPICRQDEDRSYWSVTWTVTDSAGHSRLAGRSIAYAEARRLIGSRMTFDRFFALRAELPELLDVAQPGASRRATDGKDAVRRKPRGSPGLGLAGSRQPSG
jgi:hypothetical protein